MEEHSHIPPPYTKNSARRIDVAVLFQQLREDGVPRIDDVDLENGVRLTIATRQPKKKPGASGKKKPFIFFVCGALMVGSDNPVGLGQLSAARAHPTCLTCGEPAAVQRYGTDAAKRPPADAPYTTTYSSSIRSSASFPLDMAERGLAVLRGGSPHASSGGRPYYTLSLTVSRRLPRGPYARRQALDGAVRGDLNSTCPFIGWHALLDGPTPEPGLFKSCVRGRYLMTLEAPGGRAWAGDLKEFPPTYVEVGGSDPLRDEGWGFMRHINEANGDRCAGYRLYEGGFPHGFWATIRDFVKRGRGLVERLSMTDSRSCRNGLPKAYTGFQGGDFALELADSF
ncbi:hypothetical protein DL769_003944 [Monosporascus sp. CRB-8-3]|nr:hypothetical protein DL769_003944 [Monosporascus sp. CRB-8-3]